MTLPLLLLACSLPSGGPSWDPIDVAAIEAELAAPTAGLDSTLDWLVDNAESLAATVAAGQSARDAVVAVAAPPGTVEVERDTGELSGTAVFVKVACPGPGSGPDADFAYGHVELESPLLAFDQLADLAVRGDLLLTARACQRGARTFDGVAVGWYGVNRGWLALDGPLDVTDDQGVLSVTLRAILDDPWSFVVPILDDQTVSLDVDPASPNQGVLRYDGGSLTCTLSSPVQCIPG